MTETISNEAKTITHKGVECPVVSKKGAWTTIIYEGKETKVRVKSEKTPRASKARKQPAKRATPRKAKVITGNRLVEPDLSRYTTTDITTKSGRKSIDIGDKVATMLRGKSLDDVYRIASEKTGVTQKELREKYVNLNPGMQRMNLGNRIRGALNAE